MGERGGKKIVCDLEKQIKFEQQKSPKKKKE